MSEAPESISGSAAQRYQDILLEAVRMFGLAGGTRFMTTANFALGGQAPAELSLTEEGARQVHNELAAQASDGPL